jgi:tetrahydrodipicolinate N-succinyltransferase
MKQIHPSAVIASDARIGDDCIIGPNCVILPNVRIGKGSVIKTGTFVTRDVPPHTFWGLPSAGPLGHVTVPLTREHSYEACIEGLKPMRRKR